MQFTNDLKGKLEEAKNEEEVKSIIENTKKNVEVAGVILDDADLDEAVGGVEKTLPGGKNHKYPWQ